MKFIRVFRTEMLMLPGDSNYDDIFIILICVKVRVMALGYDAQLT